MTNQNCAAQSRFSSWMPSLLSVIAILVSFEAIHLSCEANRIARGATDSHLSFIPLRIIGCPNGNFISDPMGYFIPSNPGEIRIQGNEQDIFIVSDELQQRWNKNINILQGLPTDDKPRYIQCFYYLMVQNLGETVAQDFVLHVNHYDVLNDDTTRPERIPTSDFEPSERSYGPVDIAQKGAVAYCLYSAFESISEIENNVRYVGDLNEVIDYSYHSRISGEYKHVNLILEDYAQFVMINREKPSITVMELSE